MKYKSSINQPRVVIPMVTIGCALMCVSVGFASWVVTGGSNALALGNIEADDVENGGSGISRDVISITRVDGYKYAAGYGFVNGGVYSNNVELTGQCSFDSTYGKSCFTSFRTNDSFKLDVTLTTSTSFGGFASNNISMTSISISSTAISTSSHDAIVNGSDINTTFTIVCANNDDDFDFDFSLNLSWSGSSLSSFPNLSDAHFNISFLPKENA